MAFLIHYSNRALLLLPLILLLSAYSTAAAAVVPQLHLNHRSFADALALELYENDNECTSALGISMAFSLVYPSTIGNSTTQIRDVLGYPLGSALQLVWNDTTTRLDSAYEGRCLEEGEGECVFQEPTLEIANTVWIDNQDALSPPYYQVVGDFLRQIDFASEEAGGIVNDWVYNMTNGLIEELVDEGPLKPLILLAVNTIYLKASWADPFQIEHTNKDVFYPSDPGGELVDAHFMHKVNYFPYSHEALPGFQMLKMDFVGNKLSMLILLPASNTAEYASSTDVLAALPQLKSTYMAIGLPKFQFESAYKDNLEESLKSLGMVAPFFGGICVFENRCGWIDFIIQKTFISVDEKGVEAAAATAIGVLESLPPPPTLFLADHPFQFFIYDEQEELMIFEGHVGSPVIPEDAPDALLLATHNQTDFWSSNFFVDPIVPDVVVVNETFSPTASLTGSTLSPTPEVSTTPPDSSSSLRRYGLGGFLIVGCIWTVIALV